MSKVEVDQVTQQSGTTLTVGGGACKTAVVDATTVTLGRCGGTVSLASGATQSGFGRTGTVDWITTPKVTGDSPVTGVTGKGYFLNTTAGTITLNLPAGAAGSIVSMADYAATWQTNNVTVAPNGAEKIGGLAQNATLSTEGQSVTFVYVDSTQGWINTMDSTSNVRGAVPFIAASGGNATLTVGDYKTHIFTGPGTFCVTEAGSPAGSDRVEYLVVAGGGSGGYPYRGSGGGAGGFRSYTVSPPASPLNAPAGLAVPVQAYPITIGAGGASPSGPSPAQGNNGANSVFSTIESAGGGYGVKCNGGVGGPGGSGGGGGGCGPGCAGGTGNTPPTSPAQGRDGGDSPSPPSWGGGGGGAECEGAGGAGPPSPGTVAPGGKGSHIPDAFIGPTAPSYGTPGPVGSTRFFAGGGGGGMYPGVPIGGVGGAGGGGNGGGCTGSYTVSTDATINTGGGGGGASGPNPGNTMNGGSGIVMIRYKFQ